MAQDNQDLRYKSENDISFLPKDVVELFKKKRYWFCNQQLLRQIEKDHSRHFSGRRSPYSNYRLYNSRDVVMLEHMMVFRSIGLTKDAINALFDLFDEVRKHRIGRRGKEENSRYLLAQEKLKTAIHDARRIADHSKHMGEHGLKILSKMEEFNLLSPSGAVHGIAA